MVQNTHAHAERGRIVKTDINVAVGDAYTVFFWLMLPFGFAFLCIERTTFTYTRKHSHALGELNVTTYCVIKGPSHLTTMCFREQFTK